ncbi:uncharacterized protein LOC115719161 [Cannabis sativa]|uniref:uncharacterized protein LOC115719161 n=1 Tax=Cannabis sativa TaxID=3483 RepID=UPI0029CA6F85|nr:uncharacterized protein LOC115719161 [Cannabis sativa]
MNAVPISPADLLQDQINGSDSDTNLDEDDAPEYYEPISAVADDDNDDEEEDRTRTRENGHVDDTTGFHSNGDYYARQFENGVSSLNLNNDDLELSKSSSEAEDEEEESMGEDDDTAAMRAFREDEIRRNAPLTTENATRVMEAMRGISFSGVAPDWADSVSGNHLIDHLRRLRQPPPQT